MDSYNLLTPGPVPMPKEIYEALSEPMVHHRTPQFEKSLSFCYQQLKKYFCTENDVFIHTSTGSGAMESAVVNLLSKSDEVLVVVSGKFGERWRDLCNVYGVHKVHCFEVEWGESLDIAKLESYLRSHPQISIVFTQYCETSTGALHPVKELAQMLNDRGDILLVVDAITALGAIELEMDKWGIDVVCAGSQKAFMMPTGLSFISLSSRAWKKNSSADLPRYYFDLRQERQALKKGQTFFSSAVSHVKALAAYFKFLEANGGLEGSIRRCKQLSAATLAALPHLHLKSFAMHPSPSLTAIELPVSIDGQKLRRDIENNDHVVFMGGQGPLTGKIIRMGHLGHIENKNFLQGIETLGQHLLECQHPISRQDIHNAIEVCKSHLTEVVK